MAYLLNDDEVAAILDYITAQGFLSHEFHDGMWILMKKLNEYMSVRGADGTPEVADNLARLLFLLNLYKLWDDKGEFKFPDGTVLRRKKDGLDGMVGNSDGGNSNRDSSDKHSVGYLLVIPITSQQADGYKDVGDVVLHRGGCE